MSEAVCTLSSSHHNCSTVRNINIITIYPIIALYFTAIGNIIWHIDTSLTNNSALNNFKRMRFS